MTCSSAYLVKPSNWIWNTRRPKQIFHAYVVTHTHMHCTTYPYKLWVQKSSVYRRSWNWMPTKSPQQRKIKVYFTANTSTAAADVSYSREPFIQTQQQQSQNMATWCFQSWFIEGALAFSFICLVLMLLLVVSSQIITGDSIYMLQNSIKDDHKMCYFINQ